jgi:hypothetical protein
MQIWSENSEISHNIVVWIHKHLKKVSNAPPRGLLLLARSGCSLAPSSEARDPALASLILPTPQATAALSSSPELDWDRRVGVVTGIGSRATRRRTTTAGSTDLMRLGKVFFIGESKLWGPQDYKCLHFGKNFECSKCL